MKFFKSKFFVITAIVAVLIAVTFTVMSALGYSSYIKSGLNVILTPFRYLADKTGEALEGYAAYITEFDRLKAENEELKSRIDEMQGEVQAASAIREENEQFRKYLEIKAEHLDYTFENAAVIGRESGNYMTVFTLDKGKNYGIEAGMPIIAANGGLIGGITDAGGTWASASSLTDPSSAVGAYVERSLAAGIVAGDYTLGKSGLCKMSYIADNADIQVGDRILTSGIGSVYPRGLVIGTVTEVVTDENSRSKYAIVRPLAEQTGFSSVMVLTSYEKYVDN